MFGFMKKTSTDDKKRKEKKDAKTKSVPLTKEQLQKLEDARKRVMSTNGSSDRLSTAASDSTESAGSSVRNASSSREVTPESGASSGKAYRIPPPLQPKPKKVPSRGNSLNFGGRPSLASASAHSIDTTQSSDSVTSKPQSPPVSGTYKLRPSSLKRADSGNTARGGPPRKPVTLTKPKTLQQKAPSLNIPSPRVATSESSHAAAARHSDNLDDSIPLPTSPPSPTEKIYANVDLQLPSLTRPQTLKARTVTIKRLPAGDFGFSLRKGVIIDRIGSAAESERKKRVIFAEPSTKTLHSGLLPGDRLLEVNGKNVEECSREELIEIIRQSGDTITLTVQPVTELSELSVRAGADSATSLPDVDGLSPQTTDSLQRSGSFRVKSKQVSELGVTSLVTAGSDDRLQHTTALFLCPKHESPSSSLSRECCRLAADYLDVETKTQSALCLSQQLITSIFLPLIYRRF